MLEPRYGCARAPLIGIRFADGLSAGGYAGVGLPERSEPEGMARPQVASRSEVARGLPQGAARERIENGRVEHVERVEVFNAETRIPQAKPVREADALAGVSTQRRLEEASH